MSDRIHRCLDGEIPRSALSEEELRELERLEAAIEGSVAFVGAERAPDVTEAVMSRIREAESAPSATKRHGKGVGVASWVRGLVTWIWEPRSVRLRPAWALAAVAVLVGGIGVLPVGVEQAGDRGTLAMGDPDASGASGEAASVSEAAEGSESAEGREPTIYVRFELDAEGASSVRLAGSFSGWEPRIELAESAPGHWTAMVPLEAGVHDYAFVVDGERWVTDPGAIPVRDGFGGTNSRIALLPPEPAVTATSS